VVYSAVKKKLGPITSIFNIKVKLVTFRPSFSSLRAPPEIKNSLFGYSYTPKIKR